MFIRLLLDEVYHLIKLPFERLIDAMFPYLLDELILGFCYSDLTLETGGFELASTITLVLQANRLTKCASNTVTCGIGYSCHMFMQVWREQISDKNKKECFEHS